MQTGPQWLDCQLKSILTGASGKAVAVVSLATNNYYVGRPWAHGHPILHEVGRYLIIIRHESMIL